MIPVRRPLVACLNESIALCHTHSTISPTAPLNANDGVQNTLEKLDQSLSSSSASSATGRNMSGETFGQGDAPRRQLPKRTAPTTPHSQLSRDTANDTQYYSQRSISGSFSDFSQSERSRRNTVSSSNTFGVSSPAHTLASHHKTHASTDTPPPPMPPLDHPAFQSVSNKRREDGSFPLVPSADEMGSSKVARHSHSLPSISHKSRVPSRRSIRKRARTQSRSQPLEYYSEAEYTTPISHRQAHKRSESNASRISGRRVSADFSAEQASSVSHRNGRGGSWEAQVSREMVWMSLGVKQARPGTEMIAEPTSSQSGQARGNRVGAFGLSHLSLFFTHRPFSYPSSFSFLVRGIGCGDSHLGHLFWDLHFYFN
ncbi:hypothetical protein FPV67DRAFT_752679 [Lyophyllum atratum]|nr:hypothetical protein FPV67DRAFT_752679 [Lyophyllum atratum]